MDFWLAWFAETNRGEEVKAIAVAAEELGYAGVAVSDHVALPRAQESLHPTRGIPYDPLNNYPEPITTLATMAAVTERLRFITYAYVMGMRDPFSVAKQAAALADLSGGRFSLGITPGWLREEIALLGHDPRTRGGRFEEALEVMHGLWREDLLSYQGKFYDFEQVGISPRPEVPPDILVGGHSRISIERAARHNGWIGMNHSLEFLREKLGELDSLSSGSARKLVIPNEELSDAYLDTLSALGVEGIVVMAWNPEQREREPLDSRISAMSALARRWIG
ncbi:MAG: TIGR03619 family F420-dependent LLM class oxidoreductase [Myxococcota bacterium]|nr:TIGR03619 family F420-dependent LLM class oxidoreductase [Myxococcota bacterium]